MAFQDKSYSHDSRSGLHQALSSVNAGTVPLFKVRGIQVRAHVTLLMVALLGLLPVGHAFALSDRIAWMAIVCVLALAHELAHAFVAHRTGGRTEAIVLWPLGGLGDPGARRRPWSTFLSYMAGPAMNAAICAASAAGLYAMHRIVVPISPHANFAAPGLTPGRPEFYLWYLYVVSFAMLVLNLLPALPLDGGHVLQSMLWPFVGYGRALLVACNAGVAASVFLGSVNNLHIQASTHEQAIQEGFAVAGLPHGAGSNGPVAGNTVGIHNLFEITQSITGGANGLLAQVPLGKSLPAELNSFFKRVQDADGTIRTSFCYVHSDGARADIDGRQYQIGW